MSRLETMGTFGGSYDLDYHRIRRGTGSPRHPFRDTLLPKLISGELRVKDAEHIVEIA